VSAKSIPEGYHAITPYLVADGAERAIAFYTDVFGATELMRLPAPNGRIGHAELRIGDSVFMLADEVPQHRGPSSLGGTPVSMLLYVQDVDSVFARALAAGATQLLPLDDKFYGDRAGTLTDPFGHQWTIATHVEDVSPEEVGRRMKASGGA
jgi:PhnB protein